MSDFNTAELLAKLNLIRDKAADAANALGLSDEDKYLFVPFVRRGTPLTEDEIAHLNTLYETAKGLMESVGDDDPEDLVMMMTIVDQEISRQT